MSTLFFYMVSPRPQLPQPTTTPFPSPTLFRSKAFAAGCLKASDAAVYGSPEEMVAAFKESGAALACIVSSDTVYEAEAEAAAKALTAAGAKHLYLAGKPGTEDEGYRRAGVEPFVSPGGDILALLRTAQGIRGL